MIHHQLLQVQKTLRENGILISFSGRLSQGLIEEYGEAVKTYLESEDRPKNEVFNIFSIFIEQTQNIKNYCSAKSESERGEQIAQSCIVTIGKTETGHFICSGNLIERKDAEKLTDRLDQLIGLDKNELKQLYKEALRRELPPGSSGAGIGLTDMARKARSPLEYSITPVDDSLSFFTLQAVV